MTPRIAATGWFGGDGVVEVLARPDALIALGAALVSEAGGSIELASNVGDYADDDVPAVAIRIHPDPNPGVSVSMQGEQIIITGHPAAIALLAKNVARLGSDTKALGGHIHIEHFPDHPYVRSGSLPLIVRAR